MKLGSFRLGMRTFKTGLAVMIIVAIFVLIDRGNPMIAALSAVFSLRQDFETTVEFGKSRVLANDLGGGFAIAYFLIYEYFNEASLVQILVLPTFLMLLISINDGIGNNKGIIGSTAALLMIALTIPADATYMYAVERVFDTFIGTVIAILMNIGVHPKKPEEVVAEIEARQQR
ncbi:FUSC family protein [Weissella confusa]|uniref:FUSC family protein n=1 Tax=Weissella confusa TaxID=1583 RepID=UPI0018F1E79D|nr:aromatic acid exporter family protein [Weissella confusa]MBJ7624346.1 hypothetical protein [Weissella confusa]